MKLTALRGATALFAALLAAGGLQAHETSSSALEQADAIAASQAVVGHAIRDDYILLDRDARPVRLASLRGKPLIVSFVYTGCFHICPLATRSLLRSVRRLEDRFGPDRFNVVSIGFNQPADSPQAMKAFAAQNGVSEPNWRFLSPPAAIVPALTGDFGFRAAPTPAGFDHVLQVSLVDAQGRIVRQIYGDQLPPDALDEPMTQLLAGAPVRPQRPLAGLIERVRILCTYYDPQTGTYRVNYSLPLELAGGLTFIVAVGCYMLNEWRTQRRARREALRA